MTAPSSRQDVTPALDTYVSDDALRDLIARAFDEDLGPDRVDVTSACTIPAALSSTATIHSRQVGRLAGAALLPTIVDVFGAQVYVDGRLSDGAVLAPGDTIAHLTGPMRAVLSIERTALNFLTHLSGIASLTARHVDAVAGTKARIYDTRKTIPGLRGLAKYAVACGGGCNHRMGLHDAVLIKDNHIAAMGGGWVESLTKAIAAARAARPAPRFVEVEVDTIAQLENVLAIKPAPPDMVLLDNMSVTDLRRAVALRDRAAPSIELEASGGVNLTTVAAIAQTGVDRISVGALTHSAPALDLGLDMK